MAGLTFDSVRIHLKITTDAGKPRYNVLSLHGTNMGDVQTVTLAHDVLTLNPSVIQSTDANFVLVGQTKIRLIQIVATKPHGRGHEDGDGTLTITLTPAGGSGSNQTSQAPTTDSSAEL